MAKGNKVAPDPLFNLHKVPLQTVLNNVVKSEPTGVNPTQKAVANYAYYKSAQAAIPNSGTPGRGR